MADVVVRDARSNLIIASWVQVVEVPRVGEYLGSDEDGKFWRVLAVAYRETANRDATLYVDSWRLYTLPDPAEWDIDQKRSR